MPRMIDQNVPPEPERLLAFPLDFSHTNCLTERYHGLPLSPLFGSLDYKCDTCFLLTDDLAPTDAQRHLKFALNEFADPPRVKVECVAFPHLEVVLIEIVCVIGNFTNLITDFSILRVVIPEGKGGIMLRLWVCPIKDTSIDNLLMFLLPL